MNGWCLWLQPAGLPAPTEATADFYNFQSPINACDLREKNRPPVIQIFDSKTKRLSVFQSNDPAFSAAMENLRSEEHTSELQSLMRISYAVFCLKKTNINNMITSH